MRGGVGYKQDGQEAQAALLSLMNIDSTEGSGVLLHMVKNTTLNQFHN